MDPLSVKRRLTCILAADAVGYSSQMARDEEGTVRVLSAHRAVIDGIIAFHGGRIISTAGDSVLAEFSSAVEAVRSAVEIQEALKTRNDSLPDTSKMQFRVGVNLGDVVVKGDDLLGDGVNVAARLETIAEPGGICISSSVYDQITGKLDLGFQDIGDQALKNISRPIHAYRVSGIAVPGRPAITRTSAIPKKGSMPWGVAVLGAATIAGIVAWQAGFLRFGSTDSGSARKALAPVTPGAIAPAQAPADANAIRAQGEAEAQRMRVEAEALKRQAETELARARAEADASRAARHKADSEAAAARIRAQAEADAARIRSDAEAAAARTKSEAESQSARAGQVRPKGESKSPDSVAVATSAVPASKTNSTNSASRFDGAWNVTIKCSGTPDGALGYTMEFVAQVKDGVLRGDMGTEGSPGSLSIEGPIQPDGTAIFFAHGRTGDAKYSVKSAAKGSQYAYSVPARFEGSSGTGRRTDIRPCDLHFAKR